MNGNYAIHMISKIMISGSFLFRGERKSPSYIYYLILIRNADDLSFLPHSMLSGSFFFRCEEIGPSFIHCIVMLSLAKLCSESSTLVVFDQK